MPTITTVDATWTNGMAMDEAELRRADTAMFLGDGSANGVRGGVVRHGDTSLIVSVNGSDQVTVQPGAAVIPAATGLGVYRASLPAATAATGLASRNATNPRIDLVVMQIVAGAAVVKTVDGTPSASPSAPALPASSVELGRVTVPAVGGGAVTVDSTWRAYATGLGGTLYVETPARLPGSGNIKGQRAVALSNNSEHIWNGTAWVGGAWTSWTPALQNAVLGAGGSLTGRYAVLRDKTVHFDARIVWGSTGLAVGSGMGIYLPVTARTPQAPPCIQVQAEDTGTAAYRLAGQLTGADQALVYVPGTNGILGATGPSSPFTWVAGDVVWFSGTYEAA